MDHSDGVRWPPRYAPAVCPIHVRNELAMEVPAEAVWAWLIRARAWPSWYVNAAAVEYVDSAADDLVIGTRFRWKTFGVRLESRVLEFVPIERIAWDARGRGVDAYHAWVLRSTATGCDVLTEETQRGVVARAGHLLMPNRMHKYHQIWLEGLRDNAARGFPPLL